MMLDDKDVFISKEEEIIEDVRFKCAAIRQAIIFTGSTICCFIIYKTVMLIVHHFEMTNGR